MDVCDKLFERLLERAITNEEVPIDGLATTSCDPSYRAIAEEMVSSLLWERDVCISNVMRRYSAYAGMSQEERLDVELMLEGLCDLPCCKSSDCDTLSSIIDNVMVTEMALEVLPCCIRRSLRYQFMMATFEHATRNLSELKPYSWSWNVERVGLSKALSTMMENVTRVNNLFTQAQVLLLDSLRAQRDGRSKCKDVEDLVKDVRVISSMIGYTWKEFAQLYAMCHSRLMGTVQKIRSHDDGTPNKQKIKNTYMTMRMRLFVTLWWYRSPVSFAQIQAVTGWSKTCLKETVSATETEVYTVLTSPREGRLPHLGVPDWQTLDEDGALFHDHYPFSGGKRYKVVGIVDCTYCLWVSYRDDERQSDYYCGYIKGTPPPSSS